MPAPAGVGGEVFQDSSQMMSIATDIKGDAAKLAGVIEEMYKTLNDEIGEEETGNRAWFGPKAALFITNIEAKHTDFDNAVKNIEAVGQNLQDQAEAWVKFEAV